MQFAIWTAQRALTLNPSEIQEEELHKIIAQAKLGPSWLPETPLPVVIPQRGSAICTDTQYIQLDKEFLARGKRGRRRVVAAASRSHILVCSGWDAKKREDRAETSIELRLFDRDLDLVHSQSITFDGERKSCPPRWANPPKWAKTAPDGRLIIGPLFSLYPERPEERLSTAVDLDNDIPECCKRYGWLPDGTPVTLHGLRTVSFLKNAEAVKSLLIHGENSREIMLHVGAVITLGCSPKHILLATCSLGSSGRTAPRLTSIPLDGSQPIVRPETWSAGAPTGLVKALLPKIRGGR